MTVRSGWRRTRRNAWNVLALLIIVAALGAGVVQLGLPWLVRNPQQVEGWLSERLQRPVSVGKVTSRWLRGGPELTLEQVVIGPVDRGGEILRLDRAALALNLFAPFQRNGVWNEFRLSGLELTLLREDVGRWSLRGLDLPQPGPDRKEGLGALGAFVLNDLLLHVEDERNSLKFDLAASELRLLNLSEGPRVLAKIRRAGTDNPPLDLVIDSSTDRRSGSVWIGGSELDLSTLLATLPLDDIQIDRAKGAVNAWANWNDGALRDVSVQFDLTSLRMQRTDLDALPAVDLDALSGIARFRRDAQGWDIDVADWRLARTGQAVSQPARFSMRRSGQPARWLATADRVDIEGLAPLATLAPGVPDGLRGWLAEAAPKGVLVGSKFRYDGPDNYQLSTGFRGLAASAAGRKPGLSALSGSIVGDSEATLISLPRQSLQLDFPAAFRTPLRYSALAGDIVLWHDEDGWQARTDRLVFEAEGYAGELRGGVAFPPGRSKPALDVAATIYHADLTAAKLFWPVSTPPKAMQWLDGAFLGGSLSAQAAFRGNLEDFPFRGYEGQFEAAVELDEMQMRFNPEWPTADHVDASARFLNLGVDLDIHGGETAGNRLLSGHLSIEQLNNTVVELQAKLQGRGADLLGYLRATPVGRNAAAGLEGLTIGGRGEVDLKLHIPSGHPELNTVDGNVRMRDAPIASSKWDVKLDDGNGVLHFDQHGFQAKDFSVSEDGNVGSLSLAIGEPVVDDANTLELVLKLPVTVKQLLRRVPNVAFLGETISGRSDWNISLSIPKADSQKSPQLKLASKLVGTTVALPVPIGKDAVTERSLEILLPLPAEGREYRLDYDGVLTHIGRVPRANQPYAARFDLGSKLAGPMPDAGIVVGGRARELDATGWIAFAVGLTGGGGGAGLRGVDVHADALVIGESRVPDVDVAMSFAGKGTHVELAGASVQGSIDIPRDLARAGITVHLPILHWPAPPEKPKTDDDAGETRSPFAPSSAPPMHIWVGDLRVGKAEFGETRIETRPTAAGMRIDTLDARSPMFHLSANGDWNGSPANNRTALDLELTAPDLGRVLEGFGFKGLIEGGSTEAQLRGSWPGSPVAFALSRLSGTLSLDVGQGRFLEVEPGAGGRLFGLLSLGEIRRRLSLDFTDFYKSGTSFNFIRGQFQLDGASATTDDLLIDSPAAQIKITGRTGLKTRDYDQVMTVLPKAGVALPVVGALAGGPVGAAAGLVVQNLFKKQIGAAAASRYTVSGSWEKPQIKLISRDPTSADDETPPASQIKDAPTTSNPKQGPVANEPDKRR